MLDLKKLDIIKQGVVIAEEQDLGWMVMTPDGEIAWKRDRGAVEGYAKQWFKRALTWGDIGVGSIEYRLLEG